MSNKVGHHEWLETVNHDAGFTLVELVVTILVLSIFVISLSSLFYSTQIIAVQNQHLDLAIEAARTEIEELRNNGYDSLTPGSNIVFTSSLPAQLPPNKVGSVVVSQPATGLIRVDVSIKYTDYGKSENVELSSDIGVIGIGQVQ